MKKAFSFLLTLLICVMLTACGNSKVTEAPAPVGASPSAAPAIQTEAAESESEPSPAPQWPEAEIPAVEPVYFHGELSRDELCACFSELVFSSYEYSEELNSLKVLKRTSPVYCFLSGDVSDTDRAAAEDFISSLQSVGDFPGMSLVEAEENANLTVRFCDRAELMSAADAEADLEESDSYISLSYDDATGEITDAVIYIRTDTISYARGALLQRELLRSLGLFGESLHLSDSILSPSYVNVSRPSGTDLLILSILYNSSIACGTDSVTCMAYVRALCS